MSKLTGFSCFLFSLFAGTLSFFAHGSEKGAGEKPNILWILSDDHAPMLGAYGDQYADTPTLDGLAKKGILFQNAFSVAPVCSPARSALISGMYPNSLGTLNMRSAANIPDYVKFFPKYMRDAGYYTANIGKYDFNMPKVTDVWDERVSNKFTPDWDRKKYFKKTGGKRPFFTIINLYQTHESQVVATNGEPKDLTKTVHDPEHAPLPEYYPDTTKVRQVIAQYYDNVSAVDENVNRILKSLKRDGLDINTIVFFFADHGTGIPRAKRWPYNSGLQVPFIIYVPEKFRHLVTEKPGTKTDRLVSFVDFAPTVLKMAGLPVPAHMQGLDLAGDISGPEPEYTYGMRNRMDERFDVVRSVRDKRYQYLRQFMPFRSYAQYLNTMYTVHPVMKEWHLGLTNVQLNEKQSRFFQLKPQEELYDLVNDPYETNNLAADPDYKEVLLRLRKANDDWMRRVRDVGLLPEADMLARAGKAAIYDIKQDDSHYPYEEILYAADLAGRRDPAKAPELVDLMAHHDAAVRYWAVTGLLALKSKAKGFAAQLARALEDESPNVRIMAAETLCNLDQCSAALPVLMNELQSDNALIQLYAANALDYINEQAAPALPMLRNIARKYNKMKVSQKPLSRDGTVDGRTIHNFGYLNYVPRVLNKAIRDFEAKYPFVPE